MSAAVECWGLNDWGQAEGGPFLEELHLGAQHTCGLRSDGLPQCWGRDVEGQLDGPLPSEL